MRKIKIPALIVAIVMLAAFVAACDNGGGGRGGSGGRDNYAFTYYRNYDWATGVWGEDLTTQYWNQKFNITPTMDWPDAVADEMLTLMVTSGDFPDAIWMDRNDWNRRLARDGYFVDLDTLKPLIEENYYDDNILHQTQELLKIDGTLYGIPNWARKDASGGNNCWMYTQSIWEAAGSPQVTTFDDLYNYAIAVRDNVPTNHGQPVIPVASESGSVNGENLVAGIYRSFGGALDGWWAVFNGQYLPAMYDPVYQDALVEANKWFREGLFQHSMLTDTRDQFFEKLSSARLGLIYYDHSQDDGHNFRKNLRNAFSGDSLEIFMFQGDGMTRLYPPARGLAPGRIYAEHYGTIGWNVTCIFTAAEKPERIFEFVTYLLTKQGSIEMMYGPQSQELEDGSTLWDEFDSAGNPILNFSPDNYPDRVGELGLWDWALAGHADNVDHTKFASNDTLPEAERSWVVSHQAHVFTPLMRPLTDEFTNVHAIIEADTPLQIARHACWEYMREIFPQILTATSEEAARALIQQVIDFYEANSINEIIAQHDIAYRANLALQGGSVFTRGN